jgi:outer membrane lipoprotein-sorting protein
VRLWLCLGLLLTQKAWAADSYSAREVYDHLLKAQEAQAYLSCTIVKEEIQSGGVSQRVTGTLEVASGGKAYLEMTMPSRQRAISDGQTLWVEMSDVKQVMKYNAEQLRQSGNFFLDLEASVRHYAKTSLKRLVLPGNDFAGQAVSTLELMPLDPDKAGFEKMRLWVDQGTWQVLQVELSLSGVDTRVRFENLKVLSKVELAQGAKIPDPERFTYQVPKGYEVFDLGSMAH